MEPLPHFQQKARRRLGMPADLSVRLVAETCPNVAAPYTKPRNYVALVPDVQPALPLRLGLHLVVPSIDPVVDKSVKRMQLFRCRDRQAVEGPTVP